MASIVPAVKAAFIDPVRALQNDEKSYYGVTSAASRPEMVVL
jgi:hypothetical protein